MGVGSLRAEQDITVNSLYCVVTHSSGVDLTSVPLKRVLDAVPADKRSEGAFVHLDAADAVNHRPGLIVNGLGTYEDGVDVASAAAVLAPVLGNQTLKRIELGTQMCRKSRNAAPTAPDCRAACPKCPAATRL